MAIGAASLVFVGVASMGSDAWRMVNMRLVEQLHYVDYRPQQRGWIPWWDFDRTVQEVIKHKDSVDQLAVMVYDLTPEHTIVSKIPSAEERILKLHEDTQKPILLTIANEFDPERVHGVLTDPVLQKTHIQDLVNLATPSHIAGIELDYEYLRAEDKDAFSQFVETLAPALKEAGKKTIVVVHPKTNESGSWHGAEAQDWVRLAAAADEIVVMVYDYYWQTSEPGPISPITWFGDVIGYARQIIPQDKLIIGVPAYGYDWAEGVQKAESLTLHQIEQISKKFEVQPTIDRKHVVMKFEYQDENNLKHYVWGENNISLNAKMRVLATYEIKGISFWRLGGIPDEFYGEMNKWREGADVEVRK